MIGVMEAVLRPQDWPTSVWVLILTTIAAFVANLAWKPAFSSKAPKQMNVANWPILGAWRYYQDRYDYFRQSQALSKTGNFSFYVGKTRVVALTGHEARKTYFDTKELHMGAGYAALFAGAPQEVEDAFGPWFSKTLLQLLKRDNFVHNLDTFKHDARSACEALATASPSAANPNWRVLEPFDVLYNMVYKLTMRAVGCTEVAEDPAMLKKTLSLFESLDSMKSTLRFFFPWMPTVNHMRRMYAGIQLYGIFSKIADERRRTGHRENDAFQYLIDHNTNNRYILQFVVGSLFAGQINSGINAAWVPTYLAMDPEWKQRVQGEVDGVVAKFRKSPDQSPADVLDTLELDDWEGEFPLIDLCLRESIRMGLPGTSFRYNISDRDIRIDGSGEVVPAGNYAVYLVDDVHLNPEIYPEPTKFDPGRYMKGREEDKKVPFGFVGWGVGRHPCLGMRFAKLEMNLIIAYFMASWDFELSDSNGNPTTTHPKPIDRNQLQAQKPDSPTYLRYRLRD